MRPLIQPGLGVPGVTEITAAGGTDGPKLAIVGAIHGNEVCGLYAITRLARELSSGELTLLRGRVFLVHGNPAATEAQRRHTERGADLNRMFDFRFVDELAPTLWEREHHRALELRPLFESVDAVLDLHSASAATPPFAIASSVPASEQLAAALGLDYVTVGWDGPGLLGDRVVLTLLTRRELPGVAVECGQHGDEAANTVAYECALRALAYFGLIDQRHTAARREPVHKLVVRAAVKRPSVSFRFERPLRGMDRLVSGEQIGHGDHLVLSVRSDCYVIMPNDRVAVGEDMLYVADELP